MFGKYEVTLNRVHDTVTIKEGNEKLTLTVNWLCSTRTCVPYI